MRLLLSAFALLIVLLAVLPSVTRASAGNDCQPAVDPDQPQYIIGLGSLMETASKQRSWHSAGDSLPVRLRGFERGFNARGSDIGFSTTYLGIESKAGAEMMAAL